MPATTMTKICLDLRESSKEDPNFHLAAHVNNNDRIRVTHIAWIRICPIWSQLYNAPQETKGVSKDNRFLYERNESGEWRLVLISTFDLNGKDYLEGGIKGDQDVTVHGGVEKTLKWLTDKYSYQLFTRLVEEYMPRYDIYQ